MDDLARKIVTQSSGFNCLQPSLVLLISVKTDESGADYLPRPGAFIGLF